MERGTVSMIVALVLRSAEVQPLLRDLCDAPTGFATHNVAKLVVVVLPILSPQSLCVLMCPCSNVSMKLLKWHQVQQASSNKSNSIGADWKKPKPDRPALRPYELRST